MFKLTGIRKAGVARRRSRGAAALEVIIIVPVMVFMLFGFTEVYLYLRAVSMVEHSAFALANSLGQMQNVIDESGSSNANNLGSLWADANWLASPDTLTSNGNVKQLRLERDRHAVVVQGDADYLLAGRSQLDVRHEFAGDDQQRSAVHLAVLSGRRRARDRGVLPLQPVSAGFRVLARCAGFNRAVPAGLHAPARDELDFHAANEHERQRCRGGRWLLRRLPGLDDHRGFVKVMLVDDASVRVMNRGRS
jgi:hypothetical protein